uniref:C2H2-type domain-containing protein n=1 Tax=Lotharella oceanica TaxID=641309 RepID=A0A7S2XGK6_9EUKA|mmetsp:Transcript_33561/g.62377  ORF Transcript_33561/g.62377 Transcript_33561/m.62377 type:complete len:113 (+) Transcript_33561:598-936(+)
MMDKPKEDSSDDENAYGPMPYVCAIDGKRFNTAPDYTAHMKAAHNRMVSAMNARPINQTTYGEIAQDDVAADEGLSTKEVQELDNKGRKRKLRRLPPERRAAAARFERGDEE